MSGNSYNLYFREETSTNMFQLNICVNQNAGKFKLKEFSQS
jgi:hypothetical protein